MTEKRHRVNGTCDPSGSPSTSPRERHALGRRSRRCRRLRSDADLRGSPECRTAGNLLQVKDQPRKHVSPIVRRSTCQLPLSRSSFSCVSLALGFLVGPQEKIPEPSERGIGFGSYAQAARRAAGNLRYAIEAADQRGPPHDRPPLSAATYRS